MTTAQAMLFADGIVNVLALGRDPSHEIEEERPARQRVIEGVVTVYAFQAHRLNEIGKIVEKANAKFTNGILRIELPKAEAAGVKKITIQ